MKWYGFLFLVVLTMPAFSEEMKFKLHLDGEEIEIDFSEKIGDFDFFRDIVDTTALGEDDESVTTFKNWSWKKQAHHMFIFDSFASGYEFYGSPYEDSNPYWKRYKTSLRSSDEKRIGRQLLYNADEKAVVLFQAIQSRLKYELYKRYKEEYY